MEKKNLDWEHIGFSYHQTDYRYVAEYKDGAWGKGRLTREADIVLNECANILQIGTAPCVTVHFNTAGTWFEDAYYHFQNSRLACTIQSQESHNLAPTHFETNFRKHRTIPIRHTNIL